MSGPTPPGADPSLLDPLPASHTSSTAEFPLAAGIRAVVPTVHTPYEYYDPSFLS